MASPFVAAAAQACKSSQSSSKSSSSSTSPRTNKRAWPSNASAAAAAAAHPPPKSCVCAPSTHAGSFKCRLHRVNSQGPSSPPARPQPAVSSSSTRTVEAQ